MRLLIVTEHFWPESFRVNDLARALHERGHEVEVLTALPNYPAGRFFPGYGLRGPFAETWEGIPIRRVPVAPRGGGRAWQLVANYLSFVLAAVPVLAVRRGSWDAVLVFQPTPVTTILPALLLRARGVPVIAWIQDLWPETLGSTGLVRSRLLLDAAGALSRWLYRRCDRLLAQSRAYLPVLERAGVPPARLGYLPNWAEDLFLGDGGPRPRGHPWSEGFSVMFAGNLGRVQGLDTVLAAIRLLQAHQDVHWVFVGDGALHGWLRDEVGRLGLEAKVHFVGRRPVAEMPAWFSSADAMLVTLKRDEVLAMTIPSKLQSYLAAGRPVIGSLDGEGARVIQESGAGWTAAAEDADGLAGLVLRMRETDLARRAEMGRAGRAYYATHFARPAGVETLERELRAVARAGEAR